MQPNQEQPTDWQQPAQSPPAAPFQAPVAGGSVQPVPQISEAQPIAPAEAPQPIVESQSTLAEEQLIDANSEATEFDDEQVVDDDAALLRWEGTEYVHSSRSVKWYSIFGIATVVAVVAAIMVLKSITFAILIPVMVVALLVYVRRAPDVLQYILSRKGIHVNDKLFTFNQFKSFGVVSYNGSHSVVLVPRKRFQIGQTLYFPEEIGEQLVDMLAERLPMKDVAPDAIDRLLARLHL